ncbi:MAG TPA: nitrous oxide reductase accessory protein NosL [Phycisphaerales bacterium]|nr:nitrous oxide reductase accessory protein NosL [Phycisphaerales bacterium]
MKQLRRWVHAAFVIAGVIVLVSCGRSVLTGPPELRLGRDECRECGMLINEDRCSSASIIEVQGVSEYAMFDDIGCMFDYHRAMSDGVVRMAFVHDHGSRAWVGSHAAHYLYCESEKVKTPMGSGLIAFASGADAEAARAEHGGRVLSESDAAAARRVWMEGKWGVPEGQ